MRYTDDILTIPADNADNALVLGTALHTGLEKGVQAAVDEYYNSYPIITDLHVNEVIKLEYLIKKARLLLPEGGEFEKVISNTDFLGMADYLVPVENNVYDLYDFKYTNNGSNYKKSPQLHIYKHFLEPNIKIRNMHYLIVPKINIKQKKTEDLSQFRKRIQIELNRLEPYLMPIEFDYNKVIEFLIGIKHIHETTNFYKNASYFCNWCEYQLYCEKGLDYMLLPKNERRTTDKINKHTVWLYGAPFSGKTTFANQFPDPLMLNTDGNIKFVDAPFVLIKDSVIVNGRITKKTLAWEVFKEIITELEKKDNDFKTIIVDLLEDTYEYCRLYMYDKMSITHESDDSFRAWDKVRTEFLSTIKRLMNLDYENIILISHEDTSKDITRKSGDKITAIKPNLQEKVSNKISGMVDIVTRAIVEDNIYTLSFKTSEVIFGGGRLKISTKEIPLNYAEFLRIYEEGASTMDNNETQAAEKPRRSASGMRRAVKVNELEPETETLQETADSKEAHEQPEEAPDNTNNEQIEVPVRTRKRRNE